MVPVSQELRVAIIHTVSPKTNYARELNEGFKKIGHQSSVILYGRKGEISDDLPNGKEVWTPWLFPFQIFRALIADRPSIVHLQYEFTMFGPMWTNAMLPLLLGLLKLSRVKLVTTIHAVIPYPIVNRSFVRNFAPALARLPLIALAIKMSLVLLYRLLTLSALIIFVHGEWYREALMEYYDTEAKKIRLVPYGIDDDDKIDYAIKDYYSKLMNKKKSVLFFGTLSPRKDIEGLIRTFSIFSQNHPDYVLLIAGFPTLDFRWYGDRLRKVTNELSLDAKVLFLGFVSDSAVHALYSLADFVVLPYIYGFEGPSAPLAFAVQHAIPVVGTNVGHLKEELHGLGEDLLVPVGDQVALCNAMTNLADNPQIRQFLGEKISKKKKGALWKDVAAETYFEYKKIMKCASGT